MKNLMVKTRPTMMGLRFLMAPEDSSTMPSWSAPPRGVTLWSRAKSLLWLVFSVLAALLVGQL